MTPRVRVVVVDYDGADLTLECLRSLVATDWPSDALEIVLVDNASPHPVTSRVADDLRSVRIVESPENLGFAGGNNLAFVDLEAVDYVALVNNDVTVPPGWLRPLIDELESDGTVGAVMPKVVLADRFCRVVLSSPTRRRSWLDRRQVGLRVAGARTLDGTDISRRLRFGAGFSGPEWDSHSELGWWTGNGVTATLYVPDLGGTDVELLLTAPQTTFATVRCGVTQERLTMGPTPHWQRIALTSPAETLIHTVGVAIDDAGYGSDTGYLHADDGTFDIARDITAWSGAVVAMRTDYLADTGLFDDALFMYYEDVDLSLRGGHRGWRYRVRPDSVVRHRHQAAASRAALTALYLSERNRLRVVKRYSSRAHFAWLALRHLWITASYMAHDIVAPSLSWSRPRWEPTRTRIRALIGSTLPRVGVWARRDPFAPRPRLRSRFLRRPGSRTR